MRFDVRSSNTAPSLVFLLAFLVCSREHVSMSEAFTVLSAVRSLVMAIMQAMLCTNAQMGKCSDGRAITEKL